MKRHTSSSLRKWLRQAALLVVTCGLMLALMWVVRTYVVTIFSDSQTGKRVVVSRLGCELFDKGQQVVFCQAGKHFLGVVMAQPGDTVSLAGEKYLVPQRCACNGTDCDDCRYYLVKTHSGTTLVNHHNMVGKAY